MACDTQLTAQLYKHFLRRLVKPSKLGHTDLVMVCYESSSVAQCMQNYESLHVAVMICAILVNTKTEKQTDRQLLTGFNTTRSAT